MNLLVTGARGFVGQGLLGYLSGRGVAGLATGRTAPTPLPEGWQGRSRADLLRSHLPTAVGAVVHLEVKQHVPRPTAADEAEFETVNVVGTREWLGWAERMSVGRFVLVSSIKAVAAGSGAMPEDSPAERTAPYGRSKAHAEAAVREWAAADARRTAVILRPAPVYGPGNEANLAAFVRQIIAGKPCLIGRGETRKSVVSRTNLCAAIAFAAQEIGPGCHVFNVSDPETLSLAELAALIASANPGLARGGGSPARHRNRVAHRPRLPAHLSPAAGDPRDHDLSVRRTCRRRLSPPAIDQGRPRGNGCVGARSGSVTA